MGGGPRDVAEHFMELHSSRILADERNRHHSPRKDYLQTELKVEDVISYLERLRERAERSAPPSRRTQETQTVPAALLPVPSTFLLQELPSAPAPQHLHQVNLILSDFLTHGDDTCFVNIVVNFREILSFDLDYIGLYWGKKKKKKEIGRLRFYFFLFFSFFPYSVRVLIFILWICALYIYRDSRMIRFIHFSTNYKSSIHQIASDIYKQWDRFF